MQVILLQDVAKIGRRHAVVEVPDGFARNRLIPMKMAIPATKENKARVASHTAHAEEVKKQESASLTASLAALATAPLTVRVQANEKGHLFKGVTKEMIAAAALQYGAPVPAEAITIDAPIKEIGEYTVAIALRGVVGSIVVQVVAQ